MEPEFLTVQEVATWLRIKPRRVREAITRKKLRAHRIGEGERGEFRIERTDVLKFLQETATKESDKKVA